MQLLAIPALAVLGTALLYIRLNHWHDRINVSPHAYRRPH